MGSECAEMNARVRRKARTFSRLPTSSRSHVEFAIGGVHSGLGGTEQLRSRSDRNGNWFTDWRGRDCDSNVVTEVQGQATPMAFDDIGYFLGVFEGKRPQFVTFRVTFPIDNFCQQTYDSRYPN